MKQFYKIFVISRQHFRNMVRSKAFLISTIVIPLFIMAVSYLPSLLFNVTNEAALEADIGLVDSGDFYAEISRQLFRESAEIGLVKLETAAEGREMLNTEELSAFIVVNRDLSEVEFFSLSDGQFQLQQLVQGAVNTVAYENKLQELSIPREIAEELNHQPDFRVIRTGADGDAEAEDLQNRILTVVTFSMLLYMTLILYGQQIARSVVLEKTSKTIELMMSSVNSNQLMFGKILGIGLAGVFQYLLWITITLALGSLLYRIWGIGLPSDLSPAAFGSLIIFFILGFFLYAAFFSLIGSISRDEQQVGQMSVPLIMFLILPMLMITLVSLNPGSGLVVALSIFPMTGPLIMVMRMTIGNVPLVQLLSAIGLLILSILLAALASAKVFRIGILMTGKKNKPERSPSLVQGMIMKTSPGRKLLRRIICLPIVIYQKVISPLLPKTCRYHPSCSEYARQAILMHGVISGSFLGLGRIFRCWSWFSAGHDPVPKRAGYTEVLAAYRRFYTGPNA